MKKNIGTADRLVRLILAIIIGVVILFVNSIILKIMLAVFAIFVLYEALVGWCALYAILGKNTCPVKLEK